MKINEQSHAELLSTIKDGLCRYVACDHNSVFTDIHIQVKPDSGEVFLFNDDEEELSRGIIDEWVDNNDEKFYEEVKPLLSACLNELNDTLIKKLCISKPFSFVLVDDEKETVAELLLVDEEETLLISGELLKGLDEELDDFLKKLLES